MATYEIPKIGKDVQEDLQDIYVLMVLLFSSRLKNEFTYVLVLAKGPGVSVSSVSHV